MECPVWLEQINIKWPDNMFMLSGFSCGCHGCPSFDWIMIAYFMMQRFMGLSLS